MTSSEAAACGYGLWTARRRSATVAAPWWSKILAQHRTNACSDKGSSEIARLGTPS